MAAGAGAAGFADTDKSNLKAAADGPEPPMPNPATIELTAWSVGLSGADDCQPPLGALPFIAFIGTPRDDPPAIDIVGLGAPAGAGAVTIGEYCPNPPGAIPLATGRGWGAIPPVIPGDCMKEMPMDDAPGMRMTAEGGAAGAGPLRKPNPEGPGPGAGAPINPNPELLEGVPVDTEPEPSKSKPEPAVGAATPPPNSKSKRTRREKPSFWQGCARTHVTIA
jgi:hypothetical protein